MKMKANIKNSLFIGIFAVLSVVSFSLLMMSCVSAQGESDSEDTYDVYNDYDHVFFDPVNKNNSSCDETNYWTPYFTDTTCYRWFLVGESDSAEKDSLHLMLDHNVGIAPFTEINLVLQETAEAWTNYDGEMAVITEDEIETVMKLTERPTLNDDTTGIYNIRAPARFRTNSLYYIDGVKTNTGGFWSSTVYPENEAYAYEITEHGRNRLLDINEARGIRPVIDVKKSRVTKYSSETDATEIIRSADKYEFPFPTEPIVGYNYKQLQGFTVTDNSILFFSANNSDPNNGIILSYSGDNYETYDNWVYGEMGHGNGMSFDSKDNLVIVAGPNSYRDLWFLNSTRGFVKKVETQNDLGWSFTGFGYIDDQDLYVGQNGLRAFIMDKEFNILYTIETPYDEIVQDIEYNNGYLYATTYNASTCPNTNTIYCNYPGNSSITYVYNLKYNDGVPSDDFGRLVKRIYIGPGFGELEGISFHGDEVFFGFSANIGAEDYDDVHSYRFYHLPYNLVEPKESEPEPEPESDDDDTPGAPDTGAFNGKNEFARALSSKTSMVALFVFFIVSIMGLLKSIFAKRSHVNVGFDDSPAGDAGEQN